MLEFNAADVFLTLLIGVGPVKALIVYLGVTAPMSAVDKRRVAVRTVLVAGVVALVLLLLGVAVAKLLHIGPETLAVAGGIVLLLLAVDMILGQGKAEPADAPAPDPNAVAIFPLALPLLLNPIGIVALITYSGSFDEGQVVATAGLLGIVLVIDLAIFLGLSRVKPLNPQVIKVTEIVLGFLLGALAVNLIIAGLADLGVISLSGGH